MSLKKYESFIDRTIATTQTVFTKVIDDIITLARGAARGAGADYLDVAITTELAQGLIAESGYSVAVSGFLNGAYGVAVNKSAEFLKSQLGGEFRFTDESLAILESTREADLLQFGQINDDLATRISKGFNSWARGGITRDELIEQIRDQATIINDRYIKTQIDTAFSAYNRMTTQKMAEDAGFTKFRYVGPQDSITRKFCADVLSGVYGEPVKTMEEWNQLNNVSSRKGQPSPVSAFQGGYNCRHNLVPVE